MTAVTTNNPRPIPPGRQWVSFMDLSGGLNTKRDQHAILRNELAVSQNTWNGYESTIGKRPGSAYFINTTGQGRSGTGLPGTSLIACRFSGTTYLVSIGEDTTASNFLAHMRYASVTGSSWSTLGLFFNNSYTGGAWRVRAAQMYDPTAGANVVFFVGAGASSPFYWTGPSSNTFSAVTTTSGFLPVNASNTGNIVPQFVLADGQNSNLIYAGDASMPSAVYISDPFFPQKFSFGAAQTTWYPGTYAPYIIGQNDGVNGGDITGLAKLGTTIVVFKQNAIYFMQLQSVYGNLVYTSYCVSSSTGCQASDSIIAFDQFVCFLGNDGAYTIDAYGNVQQITRNIPTFFDNTLTGFTATCVAKTSAVGVRQGSRYLLFYDAGPSGAGGNAAGYPTRGLWFDFAKPDKNGLPTTGEILGYNIAGAASLSGPNDDGNFAWTDATQDRIGKFGIGFSDFGAAIPVSVGLQAAMFYEEFGPDSPASTKQIDNLYFDIAVPQISSTTTLNFTATVTSDYGNPANSPCSALTLSPAPATTWDMATWDGPSATQTALIWSDSRSASGYGVARATALQAWQGKALQIGVTESSTNPWTLLGVNAEINNRGVLK